jgi:hypothetical protein
MALTNKDFIHSTLHDAGRDDALTLRADAVAGKVTDTEIIDREDAVPAWSNDCDYTKTPVGSPVRHNGQVYGLIQPHNAAHYPDTTPAVLAALWRVKHTTNPEKAKQYVKPTSTSDMYLKGECMIWTDGAVMRAIRDTIYSPIEYAGDWEIVN